MVRSEIPLSPSISLDLTFLYCFQFWDHFTRYTPALRPSCCLFLSFFVGFLFEYYFLSLGGYGLNGSFPVKKEVGKVGEDSPLFILPLDSAENKSNIANFFSKST